MSRPIDVESLRCFEQAATHLNFRRAAQAVHLSPAAFGERIRRLEEDLDCVLFERSTRHVALTAAGLRLIDHARACLAALARCREVVQGDGARLPFSLRLGTRFELGLSWLVPALPLLSRTRPERTIHLSFGQGDELLRRLVAGEIDALVSSVRFTEVALQYALLHEERYSFVAAPSALEARPLASAQEARDHVLVDIDPGLPLFRYFLDARPHSDDWRFARTEYLGTIAAVRTRVVSGDGVAVLPDYFIDPDLQTGALVRLFPEVSLPSDHFRLLWREDHARASELRTLAEELRALPLR